VNSYKVYGFRLYETHEDRAAALTRFQQLVAAGGWCEVWGTWTSPEGGGRSVKIADFPGVKM
jgi:hypothetical protein